MAGAFPGPLVAAEPLWSGDQQLGGSLQPQACVPPWQFGLLRTSALSQVLPRILEDVCPVSCQVYPSRAKMPAWESHSWM